MLRTRRSLVLRNGKVDRNLNDLSLTAYTIAHENHDIENQYLQFEKVQLTSYLVG